VTWLVLDLETVPSEVTHESSDSELARMVNAVRERCIELSLLIPWGMVSTALTQKEIRFPPPACWKIVCAACVMIDEGGMIQNLGVVRGETEKEIVVSIADLVERERVTLATWNGRRFDVPVFEARCLRHGISLPNFSRVWRYRYADDAHYDLMDYVSSYGAAPAARLDYAAKLVGLPGKPDGVDGSKAESMILEGRLADVQAYCLSDAVQTAGILLHVELMRGRLSIEQCRKACAALLEKVGADTRVSWVAEKTDRKVFLMEES
jgi:3'-5' exonuclease